MWVLPAKTSSSSGGEQESHWAQPWPAASSPPLPEGVKTAAARTTYWSWQTRSKGNILFVLIWVIKHPQDKQVRCRGAIWGFCAGTVGCSAPCCQGEAEPQEHPQPSSSTPPRPGTEVSPCTGSPKYQENCPKSSTSMQKHRISSSAARGSTPVVCTPAISSNRDFYLSST